MNYNSEAEVQAFGCGFALAMIVMIIAMTLIMSDICVPKSQAVEHGAAYYHPETGEFTWKDQVPE